MTHEPDTRIQQQGPWQKDNLSGRDDWVWVMDENAAMKDVQAGQP